MNKEAKEFGFKNDLTMVTKTKRKKHLIIKIAALAIFSGLIISSIRIYNSEPNKFMAITRILTYEMPIILLMFFSLLFVIFFKIYSNNKDAEWLSPKYKSFFAVIEYIKNRR